MPININYEAILGKPVLVRTYSAGLFVGEANGIDEKNIVLRGCRRLWRWHTANNGLSISEVAKYGINQKKSKISCEVGHEIIPYVEILEITPDAYFSIMTAPEYIYNPQDKATIANSGAGHASSAGDGNGGGEGHGEGCSGYGSGGGLGRGSAGADGLGDGSGFGESSSDSD